MSEDKEKRVVEPAAVGSQLSELKKIADQAAGEEKTDFEGVESKKPTNPEELPVYQTVTLIIAACSKMIEASMAAAGVPDQGLSKEEIEAIAMPAAACIDRYAPVAGGVGPEGALVISLAMVGLPRIMAVSEARVRRLKEKNVNQPERQST